MSLTPLRTQRFQLATSYQKLPPRLDNNLALSSFTNRVLDRWKYSAPRNIRSCGIGNAKQRRNIKRRSVGWNFWKACLETVITERGPVLYSFPLFPSERCVPHAISRQIRSGSFRRWTVWPIRPRPSPDDSLIRIKWSRCAAWGSKMKKNRRKHSPWYINRDGVQDDAYVPTLHGTRASIGVLIWSRTWIGLNWLELAYNTGTRELVASPRRSMSWKAPLAPI